VLLVAASALVVKETLLDRYDALLFDLDGVLFRGESPIPFAAQAVAGARNVVNVVFVTNNASRSAAEVVAHLAGVGVEASPAEVLTSAQAAAALLCAELPAESSILIVGGTSLADEISRVGLQPVHFAKDSPVAVVQGFHPDVNWRQLAEGAAAVAAGARWIATNLDMTVPTAAGIAPGNGALASTITIATGVTPESVGKPGPAMVTEAIARTAARKPLMIGDRLDTDIAAANAAGIDSLVVLTGVSGLRDLRDAPAHLRPTFIGRDLRALARPVVVVDHARDYSECNGWLFQAHDAELFLVRRGSDPISGLNAVLALLWELADIGRPVPPTAESILIGLWDAVFSEDSQQLPQAQ